MPHLGNCCCWSHPDFIQAVKANVFIGKFNNQSFLAVGCASPVLLEIYWRPPGDRVPLVKKHCYRQSQRVDEGVTVGSCRINRLLSSGDLVLLASSQQGLQQELDRFSAAWSVFDRAGMKISTKIPRYYVSLQGRVCCKWATIHCSWRRSSSSLGWYLRVTESGVRRLTHW